MKFLSKLFNYWFFLFFSFSSVFSMEKLTPGFVNLQENLGLLQQNLDLLEKSPEPKTQFAYQTFDDWYKACKPLPYFRQIHINYSYKPQLLTQDEIKKAIQAFKNVMERNLVQNDLWVNHKAPDTTFIQDPSFRPYAQKLSLDPGSEVSFHGDLHGDIHSVNDYLRDLQTKGYIDNSFKIIKPNFYIVFLGDYTDRGNYGIEIIYTLLRLKIANPDQVFLVRGNHEDFDLNKPITGYGFGDELKKKFNTDETFLRHIAQIYDLMPVVLYVGSDSHYIQCNHGGMELGYLPNTLLSFNKSDAYQWITALNRTSNFATKISADIKLRFHQLFMLGSPEAIRAFYERIKLENSKPEGPLDIGFLWNDFIVNDQNVFEYNPGRGWSFGKDFTQELLKASSTNDKKVIGVFRAHQHASTLTPMMDLILNGTTPGVGKLWQTDQTKNQLLWDGIVATFNVTPDSAYGNALKFNYDTYGVLTIGKQFPQDWKFDIYRIDTIPKSSK